MRKKKNPAGEIEALISAGKCPAGVTVPGKVRIASNMVAQLPAGLTVGWLHLATCTSLTSLPTDLRARRITFSGQWNPRHLLAGLKCFQLDLTGTQIDQLPDDLSVEYRLDLEGCERLTSLPRGLKVGSLMLRGCSNLQELPEGLECYFLDISGCTSIARWPSTANISVGRVIARGCLQLRELPLWLRSLAQLDLRDCVNIRHLPENLQVSSWIDVAGTRIRSLPPQLKNVQLRWRGVRVDERIAFSPETITATEILEETNAERRRVLLERMGYETFLHSANAEVIHEDSDAGGPRRLVRVPMPGDEALVCVSVICPSTDRQYVIRVPPTMTTCHQAAAWVAGFDNADDYRPLIET